MHEVCLPNQVVLDAIKGALKDGPEAIMSALEGAGVDFSGTYGEGDQGGSEGKHGCPGKKGEDAQIEIEFGPAPSGGKLGKMRDKAADKIMKGGYK